MANIHRIAYAVTDASSRSDEPQSKSRWTRVGVTFLNKDNSETVVLDAIPVNGRLVLQPPKEKDSEPATE